MAGAPPDYPPPAFAFAVAIVPASGLQHRVIDAEFQQVSGIDPHVEIEDPAERGGNAYVHTRPGIAGSSNLVLKRGHVTQSSALAQWAGQVTGSTLGSSIQTHAIAVTLLGATRQPLVTWTFEHAWPVRWETGQLDSNTSDVLTETLEIAYTNVTRTNSSS